MPNYAKDGNRHNSFGFRGEDLPPKAPGEFRIACLGGSTTYAAFLRGNRMWDPDYRTAYPAQLERILHERGYPNVRVINAGVLSYTSIQDLIALQTRILDHAPDLLIPYEGMNDALLRLVYPFEKYRNDVDFSESVTLPMPSVIEHSTLIRYFLVKFGLLEPHLSVEHGIDSTPRSDLHSGAFEAQWRRSAHGESGGYPSGIFSKVSAMEMLRRNRPVYFRRNIESMIDIAKARGIRIVLPSFAHSGAPVFADEPLAASPEFVFAYDEQNAELKLIARERGAYFLDYDALAPRGPTPEKYFADGFHLTPEGAKAQAELYADFLVRNNLLGKATGKPR